MASSQFTPAATSTSSMWLGTGVAVLGAVIAAVTIKDRTAERAPEPATVRGLAQPDAEPIGV